MTLFSSFAISVVCHECSSTERKPTAARAAERHKNKNSAKFGGDFNSLLFLALKFGSFWCLVTATSCDMKGYVETIYFKACYVTWDNGICYKSYISEIKLL